MSDEQQIAALRDEIPRAGRSTAWWRLGVGGLFPVPAGASLVSEVPPELGVVVFTFEVALASGAALLPVAIYRALRRFRVRQRLATLHPHQIADVLLPPRNQRGDTRKIFAPLLRRCSPRGTLHRTLPRHRTRRL